MYRGTTLLGSATTASFVVSGLTPNTTYEFSVVAKDGAGNRSPASAAVSVRTANGSAFSCRVTYVTNDWGGGFTATITITNTGTTPISAWTLGFTFPGNQQITQGWSAIWAQNGASVTAANQGWNGPLAPGAATSIGFGGSYTGRNDPPTAFTLNGSPCATG